MRMVILLQRETNMIIFKHLFDPKEFEVRCTLRKGGGRENKVCMYLTSAEQTFVMKHFCVSSEGLVYMYVTMVM